MVRVNPNISEDFLVYHFNGSYPMNLAINYIRIKYYNPTYNVTVSIYII